MESKGKLKELADSLEMSTHYSDHIQGAILLERWQKEMNQFDVHARAHLVHHLRCINLNDIAERFYIIIYKLYKHNTNIIRTLDVLLYHP